MSKGKISFLLVVFLLMTALLPTVVSAEASEETWIKFAPRSEDVSISVKPDDTGEYVATVKIMFPSSGYRVNYEDAVEVVTGLLPDGTKKVSIIGQADIEAWTGGSLTVMTEKTLTYHLGKLDRGVYLFTFRSYNFSKTCEFEVTEDYVDWILKDDQVSISAEPNRNGEYIVSVKLTLPHPCFMVDYHEIYPIVPPDGSEKFPFLGGATVKEWTGPAPRVITEKVLRYNVGKLKPGIYYFEFFANDYKQLFKFEVPEDKYIIYDGLNDKNVSISAEPNKNGEYVVNVKLTLPHSGFRVSYDDTVSIPEIDPPDGSEKSPFLGGAIVEEWTGPALQVITEKVLSYNLGKLKPGVYYFVFFANNYKQLYKFEVAQNVRICYGDLNDDGKVNSTDFSLIKRCILERIYDDRADVNADGNVNSTDVVVFKRYIFRMIDTLPFNSDSEYVIH
ncbi:dockerin type I repeat-containing protein [Acetivibrio straminisolvens]|jgi:ribosomal protein S6|uniref:Endo-1,4-beta-glucanase n=1 Tax=Acetivibrio straminisolvens JCM 21531 TaxID=1294263 RepID=W4V4K4_9FIRM|nr:dockerin type I repeat-containing protein [Acetivibrio straminisolvens]GAE88116.1 endo-1,4-beta-glucanase [Acetivibrio straminisolvens JCM 21531]